MGQGMTVADGIGHGESGGDIEHYAAHIQSFLAGRDFPAGNGLDDLLFVPQRIPGGQCAQFDAAAFAAHVAFQRFYGIELIAFHRDHAAVYTQYLGQSAGTQQDLGAAFQQQTVVCGDIRIAFGGVDDQGIGTTPGTENFPVGGRGVSAHIGNAGLCDTLQDRFLRELIQIQRGERVITGGIFSVVGDDDGGRCTAPGIGTVLDGFHHAGNAGVNMCAVFAVGHGDQLAYLDIFTYADGRNGRGAGTHIQRDGETGRSNIQRGQRFAAGGRFSSCGVDSAKKRTGHKPPPRKFEVITNQM